MGQLLMSSKAPLLSELFGGESKGAVSLLPGFKAELKQAETSKVSVGQQFMVRDGRGWDGMGCDAM